MPSLILELTDKTDEKRLEQSHKWFSDISHFYSITKDYYIFTEIIFRQLIMHEKFNTPFTYENEKSIPFPIKSGGLNDFIQPYLKKLRQKKTTDCIRLPFKKWIALKGTSSNLPTFCGHDFFVNCFVWDSSSG